MLSMPPTPKASSTATSSLPTYSLRNVGTPKFSISVWRSWPQCESIAEGVGVSAMLTATAEELLTSPGRAMGTMTYMSPEQARGEELDARIDLSSFGAVLCEMATGQMAFPGSTAAIVYDAILNRAPVPLHGQILKSRQSSRTREKPEVALPECRRDPFRQHGCGATKYRVAV
jgi:serine/threonine protein kinase